MMSASGSCRTSCARSLYVDLLCKISLSGSLHQDPVGPLVKISVCGSLVQDLSVMMSASGSCRTSCTRSLYEDLLRKVSVSRSPQLDYLCRISVCGSLVKDLSGMMSASGSSRTSCARSLYGDLLCKISLSSGFCRASCARSLYEIRNRNFNPSQELSPLTSKYRIHGADSLRLPRKTQSFE